VKRSGDAQDDDFRVIEFRSWFQEGFSATCGTPYIQAANVFHRAHRLTFTRNGA
jgi:hypothetical protein